MADKQEANMTYRQNKKQKAIERHPYLAVMLMSLLIEFKSFYRYLSSCFSSV